MTIKLIMCDSSRNSLHVPVVFHKGKTKAGMQEVEPRLLWALVSHCGRRLKLHRRSGTFNTQPNMNYLLYMTEAQCCRRVAVTSGTLACSPLFFPPFLCFHIWTPCVHNKAAVGRIGAPE